MKKVLKISTLFLGTIGFTIILLSSFANLYENRNKIKKK